MFKGFNIDNYESKFIELGFIKTSFHHVYFCDYCDDFHESEVFEKDNKGYYFNIELKIVEECFNYKDN